MRQRTLGLLAAIDLLRSLPHELIGHGYWRGAGAESLALPPTCLVSSYPPGARYARHLDCYGDDNARALTLILYANDEAWSSGRDGGSLRLESGEGAVEVAPAGGTLVLFDSRRVWHEVLPSRRLRFAVTQWVYGVPAVAKPPFELPAARADGDAARRRAPLLELVRSEGLGRTQWQWASGADAPPRE